MTVDRWKVFGHDDSLVPREEPDINASALIESWGGVDEHLYQEGWSYGSSLVSREAGK